jgi:hypothetical protein
VTEGGIVRIRRCRPGEARWRRYTSAKLPPARFWRILNEARLMGYINRTYKQSDPPDDPVADGAQADQLARDYQMDV